MNTSAIHKCSANYERLPKLRKKYQNISNHESEFVDFVLTFEAGYAATIMIAGIKYYAVYV